MQTVTSKYVTAVKRRGCILLLYFGIFVFVDCAAANIPAELSDAVVVFGGDAAYPPFEWRDQGKANGLNVDLQAAIADVGGVRAEHRLGDWPDIIRQLDAGTVDIVAMFRSEERERRFRFSRPFKFVNHAIYGRSDAVSITSVDDLSGLRVALEELSYAHHLLQEANKSAQLITLPNTVAALQAVAEGRADYTILSEPAADFLIRSRKLDLIPIGPPIWPTEYAFAVRKDRVDLARWIDEQLNIVITSGLFQEIQARRDDQFLSLRDKPASRWLTFAVLPLGAIVLLGIWWVWSLRRRLMNQAYRLVDESRRRKVAESRFNWAEDHYIDTELPKQHHFTAQATKLLEQSGTDGRVQVVALQLAELDRTIRTFGHDAGLNVVRQFVQRIRSAGFPAYGQMGRDVFAIFGDKTKINRELRAQSLNEDTVSMKVPFPRIYAGAATFPQHGQALPELLRKAETALGRAIERRQGWVDFRPSMEPDREAIQLVSLFRNKGGDVIYPVFQPQLDLVTGEIIGAEALARWNTPGKSQISPGVFIPLLEDAKLIQHVTSRMIREAVRVATEMRRHGTPCSISVNVTGNDLIGWKLSKCIFKALREYEGHASDLKLELTETSVVDRPEILQWKMQRLTKKGIDISVDDFGTGYSSLAYLSDFPVREIKIDQSFVRDMMSNKKNMSIVTSTISMGHDLGLIVVAEGVETEAALDKLRQYRCDRAQGYVISRPLSEADFVEFLSRHRPSVKPQRQSGKVASIQKARQNRVSQR